jgi:hypothetical protein
MSIKINSCLCCGGSVLRHIRHNQIYWFCTSCKQEVPLLNNSILPDLPTQTTNILPQPVLNSVYPSLSHENISDDVSNFTVWSRRFTPRTST